MSSDMLVALAKATADGSAFFAVNCNRPASQHTWLSLTPASDHVPGETALASHLDVQEVRHTWGVLAGRAGSTPGHHFGVNEKGVAIACTPIATRMLPSGEALTGPELVRLGLQRAGSAYQAVEIITDLISRYGQGGGSTPETLDVALLIADAHEAYVIEAAGFHWVLAQVGVVRAVTSACMLRQDWDRISRGLAGLAIERGWWPEDGCKLDFASAVGRFAPDHSSSMHRWGRATIALEHHAGAIDLAQVRHILRDQAELVSPCAGPPGAVETAASFIVRLGPDPADLPIAWCAFGSPAASVYLPVFPVAELPASLGEGGSLRYALKELTLHARQNPKFWTQMRSALADLQERLDEHAHDFISEARSLHRNGRSDELHRLIGSFMHYCTERASEVLRTLLSQPGESSTSADLVLQGANF